MLIKSLRDNKEWLWINIPKTATTVLLKTFFPNRKYNEQQHRTYRDCVREYGVHDYSFTVVRHPVTRFMSALNHIFSVCECGKCKFDLTIPPTMEEVILFVEGFIEQYHKYDNYFSLLYANNTNKLHLEFIKLIQMTFVRNIEIYNIDYCVRWAAFMPQTFMLDGARNTRIYQYEHLDECFVFIRDELGYEVQPNIRYRNYTNKLINVNVDDIKFRCLLYELYHTDFNTFGYDYASTIKNR